MKLTVVSAGLRTPSSTGMLADRLCHAASHALAERGLEPDEVVTIEVRDHGHAVVNALLAGFPTGELADALADVTDCDVLLLVTPVYQAGISGLFKSFMDLLEAGSLRGKPVLLAATGGSERHSLVIDHHLRPLVSYLGGMAVPYGVYAATQDFGGEGSAQLAARVELSCAMLAALVAGAPDTAPDDAIADPTPFEEILRRVRG